MLLLALAESRECQLFTILPICSLKLGSPKAVLEKKASEAAAAVAAALNEHAAANKAPVARKRGGPAATQ